jgi:hypothetical protein
MIVACVHTGVIGRGIGNILHFLNSASLRKELLLIEIVYKFLSVELVHLEASCDVKGYYEMMLFLNVLMEFVNFFISGPGLLYSQVVETKTRSM